MNWLKKLLKAIRPPTFEEWLVEKEAAKKPLKPFVEHQAECERKKFDGTPGYATGVACPTCGAELFRFIGGGLGSKPSTPRAFCRACCNEVEMLWVEKSPGDPRKTTNPVRWG